MIYRTFEFDCFRKESKPINFASTIPLDEFESFLQKHWEERRILYSDHQNSSQQAYCSFNRSNHIFANGYIGTIFYHGLTFNIYPKIFSKANVENHEPINLDQANIEFISKLLTFSPQTNLAAFNSLTDDVGDLNLFELMSYLYAKQLSTLLFKHPYYQYEVNLNESSTPKGKINWNRYSNKFYAEGNQHIFPFETSNFLNNNLLNQIIKRCLALLMNRVNFSKTKSLIKTCFSNLVEIEDKSITYADCDKVKLNYFYQDYEIILKFSKLFLLQENLNMTSGQKEGYCFLFPVQEMFEEYVASLVKETIPKDYGVSVQNSTHYVGTALINSNYRVNVKQIIEDIVVYPPNNKIIVIDTKYKQLSDGDIVTSDLISNDLYQIITYGLINQSEHLCLIYPANLTDNHEITPFQIKINNSNQIIHIIKIPLFQYSLDALKSFLFKSLIF
jgi:5-methylcytosine-specific restriction enzyme subunit McrC